MTCYHIYKTMKSSNHCTKWDHDQNGCEILKIFSNNKIFSYIHYTLHMIKNYCLGKIGL